MGPSTFFHHYCSVSDLSCNPAGWGFRLVLEHFNGQFETFYITSMYVIALEKKSNTGPGRTTIWLSWWEKQSACICLGAARSPHTSKEDGQALRVPLRFVWRACNKRKALWKLVMQGFCSLFTPFIKIQFIQSWPTFVVLRILKLVKFHLVESVGVQATLSLVELSTVSSMLVLNS